MNPKNKFLSSISNFISNAGSSFRPISTPVANTPVQNSPYQVGVSAPRPGVTAAPKPVVTSSPGATGTTKAPVATPAKTTPTSSPLSSAGKQFVSTLAPDDVSYKYRADTGALNTNYSGYTAPAGDATTGNTTTSTTPEDPYIKYLSSLFNSDETTKARESLNTANTKLADIQNEEEAKSLAARREQDTLLDASGGLKSGAQESAQMAGRRSNSELADLAVREGAAARSASVAKDTYDQYINAGKTVYEATQAANKAKKDQENADRTYNLSKTGQESTIANSKAATELANKKFEEDKRQYGLDYALKQKELGIKQQEANQKSGETSVAAQAANDTATGTISLINNLLANPKLGNISGGLLQRSIGGLVGDAALAKNQYNQVKGLLSLENRSKLKGQGAVSDFEGKMLESAASALGRNLSDEEFVRQLKQVKGAVATSHGQTAEVLIIDPKTKQSQIISSNSQGIAQAIRDGLRVEYQ